MEKTLDQLEISKYPTYKDSGAEWLGIIPFEWEVTRVKNVFRLVIEPAPKNNDFELLSVYTDIGVKPRKELEERGNKASTTDGYWFVKKGDVVVNKLLAWMGAIGVSNYDGVTSPAYDILRPKAQINSNFYHYLFRNSACISELRKHSRGIMDMRLRLYFDKFGDIKIPFPSLQIQNQIVKYLDKKTALIDQAIQIKEKQIALLKERRQILIHQAVTRGLDPNVKLKDSGVEWIGMIPEHWEVKKLKYLAKLKYGLGQPPKEKSDGLPIIRATNVERGIIVEKGLIYVDPDDIPWERDPVLKENDIIVVRSGAYTGDSAIITKKYDGAIAGYDMVMRPNKINAVFLSSAMISSYVLHNQLYLLRMRAAQPHLNLAELGETLIVVPNETDQILIIHQINEFSTKIIRSISLKEDEIEKLKEYKSTLINSAVTGKIKVN